MSKQLQLQGLSFGSLHVLEHVGSRPRYGGTKESVWLCRCACGNEVILSGIDIKSGRKAHCGRERHPKPLMLDLPRWRDPLTYRSWIAMRYQQRAEVYLPWHEFAAFVADMGSRPSQRHRLVRVDLARGFVPGNVEWRRKISRIITL